MLIGSNVPNLTQGPLTMRAEQRDKGAKLVPTGLQFAPFLQILVLLACAVEELLGCHITVLDTESTLIHAPERKTRNGIVETSSHLGTHIFPTGTNIATPGSSRVTLFASEATTSEQEYTWLILLALPYRTLTIVDGIGIDGAIGIEIFC